MTSHTYNSRSTALHSILYYFLLFFVLFGHNQLHVFFFCVCLSLSIALNFRWVHIFFFAYLNWQVYDVTRPETFDNLSKWLEEVETYHPGRGREVREVEKHQRNSFVRNIVGKLPLFYILHLQYAEGDCRRFGTIFQSVLK